MAEDILIEKKDDDEIDLILLVKRLFRARKTIILIGAIFFAVGVIVALLSPTEYSVTTTMLPQVSDESGSSGVGGLAAMVGINIGGSSGSDLSPSAYPKIAKSILFQKELIETKFTFDGVDHQVSLLEYYSDYKSASTLDLIKRYTIGLPGVILGKGDSETESNINGSFPNISLEEIELIELLSSNIDLVFDDKDGYIILTVRMPEALLSAQVADRIMVLLREYITKFKIQKATEDYNVYLQTYNERKVEFESIQEKRALLLDRNMNLSSELARTTVARTESDYQISLQIFKELSLTLEQAKLRIKEETPSFAVIEPVIVPHKRSKPKKSMIVIIWSFLGAVVGVGVVLGRHMLSGLKESWDSSE